MTHRLIPRAPVNIRDLPTDGREFYDSRKKAEREFKELREELIELQPQICAEDKHKLLIVLQASMDAGGKDSAIRKVFRGVNPQGVRVHSFKGPTKEELAYDYLWRVHKVVPTRGMIGVFNRSHYEDVLVVRVEDIVSEPVWRKRYDQIIEFEELLWETGTTILKFYLHISLDEQKSRFQDRLDVPSKHWKFSLDDLGNRKKWEQYMDAYEEAIYTCTAQCAPWHLIPANQKWCRHLAMTKTIVEAIRELDPQFPTHEDDLSNVVIE